MYRFPKHLRTPALLATLLFLSACGGGDGDATPRATDVSVTPASLEVVLGAAESATLTVGDGFDGPVSFTAGGVPDGIHVSFDPASVEAGGNSTLTVAADRDATEGGATITIGASDGDAAVTTEVALTVTGLSGSGVVTDMMGEPVEGVSVRIGGETLTTDADGAFAFDGVAPPYDLTVFSVDDEWAHRWEGLRTSSPHLVPFALAAGNPATRGIVEGTFDPPLAADQEAWLCLEGSDVGIFGCDDVSTAASDDFGIEAGWPGPDAVDVTLRAVVHELTGGIPTGIVATGSTGPFELLDGATEDVTQVLDGPTNEAAFDVEVNMPSGFDLATGPQAGTQLLTHLAGGRGTLPGPTFQVANPAPDVVAPAFPGADYTAMATAGAADDSRTLGWVTDLSPGDAAVVELDAPPSLRAPSGGASGVTTDTAFVVEAPDGHGRLVAFNALGTPQAYVSTLEESTTLPDLAALDPSLAWPTGTSIPWVAFSFSGIDGPDMLAAGTRMLGHYLDAELARFGYGDGPDADGTAGTSARRSFTID